MRDRSLLLTSILVAVLAILAVLLVRTPGDHSSVDPKLIQNASVSVDKFGIAASDLNIHNQVIRRNQTFADLLAPHNVAYERIVTLASDKKDVFDVRKLKAGRPYHVYTDSTGTAQYMVYERDPISFVVFEFGESPTVRVQEREITVRIRNVEGIIENSLWMTLINQNIHPTVATRMSEVFAWQIDFTRIQKGDAFRIVFEEMYVGGERYGTGNILAARFVHLREDFYAFHFSKDKVDEHYDENGKSLRKAFLMAPVDFSRISSSFSGRRFHPVQGRYKAHLGTDYAAPRGTPIKATGDGVISEARYKQYNGNYVKIRHNGTYSTQYLHMSKIKSGIRPGTVVKQRDTIGYVGSTGLATGNHVCYRFWKNGAQVNHRTQKLPSVGPIPARYSSDFDIIRDEFLFRLSPPIDPTLDLSYARLLETPKAITTP